MNSITAVLLLHEKGKKIDLQIPLDITVNDLIYSLDKAYGLGIGTKNPANGHLQAENPVCLLRGNKPLSFYGLHDGTVLHITQNAEEHSTV